MVSLPLTPRDTTPTCIDKEDADNDKQGCACNLRVEAVVFESRNYCDTDDNLDYAGASGYPYQRACFEVLAVTRAPSRLSVLVIVLMLLSLHNNANAHTS